jgi:hypothetical protein
MLFIGLVQPDLLVILVVEMAVGGIIAIHHIHGLANV